MTRLGRNTVGSLSAMFREADATFERLALSAEEASAAIAVLDTVLWSLMTPAQRHRACKRLVRDWKWDHYIATVGAQTWINARQQIDGK